MTAVPTDPAASVRAPVAHRGAARASAPGGSSSAAAPAAEEDGKTSPQHRRRERAAVGTPGPETAPPPSLLGQAAVRARVKTPAGASGHDSPPAGSRGLSGAEWRAAAKRAQSRRQPSRAAPRAAAKVTIPPPVTGGTVLTATATCLVRCDWTAGPGDPAEVDKAAEKHTTKPPKHPTSLVSKVATATERPGAA